MGRADHALVLLVNPPLLCHLIPYSSVVVGSFPHSPVQMPIKSNLWLTHQMDTSLPINHWPLFNFPLILRHPLPSWINTNGNRTIAFTHSPSSSSRQAIRVEVTFAIATLRSCPHGRMQLMYKWSIGWKCANKKWHRTKVISALRLRLFRRLLSSYNIQDTTRGEREGKSNNKEGLHRTKG